MNYITTWHAIVKVVMTNHTFPDLGGLITNKCIIYILLTHKEKNSKYEKQEKTKAIHLYNDL